MFWWFVPHLLFRLCCSVTRTVPVRLARLISLLQPFAVSVMGLFQIVAIRWTHIGPVTDAGAGAISLSPVQRVPSCNNVMTR